MTEKRLGLIAVLSVLPLVVGTPAAGATTVELQGGVLAIDDTEGIANVLDVRQLSLVEYEVYDRAGGLVSGVGCGSLSTQIVHCAGQTLGIRVNAGAGDDLVGVWDLPVPVELRGDEGDDGLAGGDGPDQVWGGPGEDSLAGGPGEDRLSGEESDDFADGNNGADTVLGGSGDDILDGMRGDGDVVTGGDGEDLVDGGLGSDQLEGGGGDDVLVGGQGRDAIGTGLGSDDVFGGGGRNQIDCREGDRARGQAGELPPGCAALPADETLPVTWPPQARAAARGSMVVYKVVGEVIRGSDARRYWVWPGAPPGVNSLVRVVARLRRGDAVLHKRCFSNTWTNKKTWHKVPRKAREATRVTGRVRVGRRCP